MGDLHPMEWRDDAAEWMGQSIRAAAPRARLVSDTRALRPGDWLVVRPGQSWPLERILGAALASQPGGLVVDSADRAEVQAWLEASLSAPMRATLALRELPRLQQRMGILASAFYGHPSHQMELVAVTGTNGKSTAVHFLAQAWSRLGMQAASVGTLGVRSFAPGAERREWAGPGLTSWDAVSLQALLEELRQGGIQRVAMEASSIGLVQHRLTGCRLAAAAITSLGSDHLDVHGTLAAYGAAKSLLFEQPGLAAAVVAHPLGPVAADDPLAQAWAPIHRALQALPTDALLEVSVQAGAGRVQLSDERVDGLGLTWRVHDAVRCQAADCHLPLGRHNAQNAAVVLGLLLQEGLDIGAATQAVSGLSAPEGRLSLVSPADPAPPAPPTVPRPVVFVDYAHTADGLAQICAALRPLAESRSGLLRLVFGCGGDRDRSKRPEMGRVAAASADRVVVTSDNPRSESPAAIIEDILAGIPASCPARIESVERRDAAIRLAIGQASPHDVILIAGKGHEKTQVIGGVATPFSDHEQAQAALARPVGGLTLEALGAAVSGCRVLGRRDGRAAPIDGVVTDSRRVRPGDLFVALIGEQHNGHHFLEAVVAQGAVAVLVSEEVSEAVRQAVPVLQVADTRRALGELAAAWRQRYAGEVWAVTGSNGKTTVKEMLRSIAAAAYGESATWATPGNLNNEIGLPLSLLGLRPHHDCAVLEIGMNHPGELAPLAAWAAPQAAIVTNAQREHQAFMGTVEACARENGLVFEALRPAGIAVFPRDAAHEDIWRAQAAGHRCLRFGLASDVGQQCHTNPDQTVEDVLAEWTKHATDWPTLRIRLGASVAEVGLRGLGQHFARNACGAAALAYAAGVPVDRIAQGLSAFTPVQGRGTLERLPSGDWLVDDTYNANPDSVLAAIEALADQPGRRALVLGDMGEVGDQGPAFHEEVLLAARAKGIEAVWLLGPAFGEASHRTQVGQAADDPEVVVAALTDWLQQPAARDASVHATVWFKASRYMRLEQTYKAVRDAVIQTKANHAALSH